MADSAASSPAFSGEEHDWVVDPEKVKQHAGHRVEIVTYGTSAEDGNLAIECLTCYTVIADIDFWTE